MKTEEEKQGQEWGKRADKFDENARYVVGGVIYDEISERLSKEENLGNVIEFGCGTGYFTKVIARNAGQVIATDVSEDKLEMTRAQLKEDSFLAFFDFVLNNELEMARRRLKGYKNVYLQKADCNKSDFPDNEFDSVFMANLLHVIEKPSYALEESFRILKPEGSLIAIDLTGYGMKFLDRMKCGYRNLRKTGMFLNGTGNIRSPDYFKYLAENAGFKVEENELLGDKIKAVYFKGVKK
ncbi:MAG: class I SAM-dependent methyltransferase [archaeon]|nr:class I SAM-dependent methyltransferase [archaeon]